jgi:16S rRNA (guanine1516-N2)-methyltransferase
MMSDFQLVCEDTAQQDEALQLASRYGFNISGADPHQYQLFLTSHHLELRPPVALHFKPLFVEFLEGKAAHRLRFGGGRGQSIARACGLKGGFTPTILDLTAGLGRDAFVLAGLDCNVTMVERNPVIAALLEDGLKRAEQDPTIGSWVKDRLILIYATARDYLSDTQEVFDVIYLDPMFPGRSKSASVKKEMQVFHDIVGNDPDSADLLGMAMKHAGNRVVVKRPRLAPTIDGQPSPSSIEGKSTRFDLYPIT